jgi:hypothetical protein
MTTDYQSYGQQLGWHALFFAAGRLLRDHPVTDDWWYEEDPWGEWLDRYLNTRQDGYWLSDGTDDQETNAGSWPLNNILLANALKLKGYDFHFSFGGGTHHAALAVSELAECLTWLWRDYDPKKSEQTFEQAAEEKAKPPFRVRIYNR